MRSKDYLAAMVFVILWLIIMLITSCKTKYVPIEVKTTETVTLRDTTIIEKLVVTHDSVTVQDTASYLKNQYCESYASYDGVLHHSLNTLPDAHVEVVVQEKEIVREVEKPVPYEVEKVVSVEKSLGLFDTFALNLGKVTIFAAIIYIVYLLTKGGVLGHLISIVKKGIGL